jgi:hypothetical protein
MTTVLSIAGGDRTNYGLTLLSSTRFLRPISLETHHFEATRTTNWGFGEVV